MPISKSLQLYVHHDEDAKIYLNGVLAASLTGFTAEYDVVEMTPAARSALKPARTCWPSTATKPSADNI